MVHPLFQSHGSRRGHRKAPGASPARIALLATALLCFAGVSAAQAVAGKPHTNERYGYSFVLPAELDLTHGTAGRETLRSRDGALTIEIDPISESRPGFPGNDPETENQAGADDCDHLPPPYVLKKRRVVAFSCTKGATIHYAITRYTDTGSVSMDARYPASARAHWDPVVSTVAISLKRTR